jgi:hypothetical protein
MKSLRRAETKEDRRRSRLKVGRPFIGQLRTRHIHPIIAQAKPQGIGLRLQAPAGIIKRPLQLQRGARDGVDQIGWRQNQRGGIEIKLLAGAPAERLLNQARSGRCAGRVQRQSAQAVDELITTIDLKIETNNNTFDYDTFLFMNKNKTDCNDK